MTNLPTSRDYTLNPGDPVPSLLLNTLQDMIIGDKRAQYTKRITPRWIDPGPFVAADNPANISEGHIAWKSTATGTAKMALEFEAADSLIGVSWDAYGTGSPSCDAEVDYKATMAGARTALYAGTDTARSAAWGTFNLTPFTSQVLATGGVVFISILPSAANYYIGFVSLTLARL